MEENRERAGRKLGHLLNELLFRKYGRRISAQKLADQFNLRAKGTKTISRETARKWLSGMAIPQYDRLVVLVDWLGLDTQDFLTEQICRLETAPPEAAQKSQHLGQLRQIMLTLDENSIHALLAMARALSHQPKTQDRI
jgi:hypothetical protein